MKIHPAAKLFPMLGEADLKKLADDIRANGLQQPVVVQAGTLLDGRNRLKACAMAGIEARTIEYQGDNAVRFIISSNLHRRHLSTSQRSVVANKLARLPAHRPGKDESGGIPPVTQSAAAELLKVSRDSVKAARAIEEASPALEEAVGDGTLTLHAAKEILANAPQIAEQISAGTISPEAAAEIVRAKAHVSHNSGNNEWYTPAEIIEAARQVLGSIDLDPASTKKANKVVQAAEFYTAEEDGLEKPWAGNVWMNPPYASKLIGRFADKLAAHVDSGEVKSALVLVNNATETQWFQSLASRASALCLLKGRVKFWSANGDQGAPLQGQAILYFGKRIAAFTKVFNDNGCVFGRC